MYLDHYNIEAKVADIAVGENPGNAFPVCLSSDSFTKCVFQKFTFCKMQQEKLSKSNSQITTHTKINIMYNVIGGGL